MKRDASTWRYRHLRTLVRLCGIMLLTAMCVGMVGGLWRYYNDPSASKTRGWQTLAATIDSLTVGLSPEAVRIAQNYPDPTLWFYYRGVVEHIVLPPSAFDEAGAMQSAHMLAEQGVQRVVLPVQPADNWDPTGTAADALASEFRKVVEQPVGAWTIAVYSRPPDTLTRAGYRFENGVQLEELDLVPASVPTGGLVVVHLKWNLESGDAVATDKVFVHLLDSDGRLVAQNDQELAHQAPLDLTSVASYGILIPHDVASGEYIMIAGLYDPTAAVASRYRTIDGHEYVELGTLTVVK